jgi:hypothetical protein
MAEKPQDPKSGPALGGRARAAKLSPSERREIAKKAAAERWHGDTPRATHEGALTIAELTLQCAVLQDGRRVLSERGVLKALGMSGGGSQFKRGIIDPSAADGDAVRLPMFVANVTLRPFIGNELLALLMQPVLYRSKKGGQLARGLEATLIPKVCEVWLRARDAKVLRANQLGPALKADALMRGLANTGIIALVDEATGYQEVRDRQALQAILDAFLRKEFAAWAKRFPDEYFHEIFRLRGWKWDELRKQSGKGQGPRVIGKYTNDIVYSRLAPGILDELQMRNPPSAAGQRRVHHHRFFTEEIGHPALAQHLSNVITLMRGAENWEEFKRLLNRAIPPKTDLRDLPLFSQPVATIEPKQLPSQSSSVSEKKAS